MNDIDIQMHQDADGGPVLVTITKNGQPHSVNTVTGSWSLTTLVMGERGAITSTFWPAKAGERPTPEQMKKIQDLLDSF